MPGSHGQTKYALQILRHCRVWYNSRNPFNPRSAPNHPLFGLIVSSTTGCFCLARTLSVVFTCRILFYLFFFAVAPAASDFSGSGAELNHRPQNGEPKKRAGHQKRIAQGRHFQKVADDAHLGATIGFPQIRSPVAIPCLKKNEAREISCGLTLI